MCTPHVYPSQPNQIVPQFVRPVLPQAADDLPSNLYKIKVFGDTGYILGSNGVLLRGVVA